MANVKMEIKIHPAIKEALDGIVDNSKHCANPMHSTEELVGFILMSLADGFNRSGSWERTMLEKMGLA